MAVIQKIEAVTADWLTESLRLHGGVVSQFEAVKNDAFNSSVAHLSLEYTKDASAPKRLILKLNQEDWGLYEACFYQHLLRSDKPLLVVPHCYAAEYENGNSAILLEDLSDTHVAPVTREQSIALQGMPSDAHLMNAIGTLAQFHAYWWQHPILGDVEAKFGVVRPWYTDFECYQLHMERRQREYAAFINAVGDKIPTALQSLYEQVLERMPRLWQPYLETRVTTLHNITLSQGDCYLSQFLCPKNSSDEQGYLIDFQDVSANFPAYDLVYMLATFWTAEQRQYAERHALKLYHEALVQGGVTSYTWDDLLLDYRLMLTFMIFDPVWNQTSGSPESYWWP